MCVISTTVHNLCFLKEAPLIKFSLIDPARPSLPPNDLIVIYDKITQ